MKRVVSLIIAMIICLSFAGCKKKEEKVKEKPTTTTTTTKVVKKSYNPLTGESDFNVKYAETKPFAVMINNIQLAQTVQTGVGDADMVFETLAEGGITRLLAVYQDVSKVDQIGSVRSARISYAQLAAGLDANYVHCGADNKYCGSSYRSSIGVKSYDLGSNAASAGKRISEHSKQSRSFYTSTGLSHIRSISANVFPFVSGRRKTAVRK